MEKNAGFSESDSAPSSLEKWQAHISFEMSNLLGECWLRDSQPFCSFSDMHLLGNYAERSKMMNLQEQLLRSDLMDHFDEGRSGFPERGNHRSPRNDAVCGL